MPGLKFKFSSFINTIGKRLKLKVTPVMERHSLQKGGRYKSLTEFFKVYGKSISIKNKYSSADIFINIFVILLPIRYN